MFEQQLVLEEDINRITPPLMLFFYIIVRDSRRERYSVMVKSNPICLVCLRVQKNAFYPFTSQIFWPFLSPDDVEDG